MLPKCQPFSQINLSVQFVAQAEPIFAHLYACYNNVAAKADKMEK